MAAACGVGSSGPSSSSKGVTATYMKSGTYDTAAKALAGPFKSKTGNSVNVQAFPYAALRQNNTNAIISGTCQYNVVSGSYYLAPIYSHFKNLDSLAAKSHYAQALTPGLWAHSEFNDGHHIGLPYGPDAYGLMIRKDLFSQAGLSAPTTWTQLLSDLGTLKQKFGKKGIAPFVFSAGAPEQLPALLFAGYDGSFINAHGHYQLETAKAVAAIKLGQKLMSYAPNNSTSLSIDAANSQFTNGKAAVLYGYPSFVRQQADASKPIAGKWAVVPDPQPGFVWLSLWQLYMTDCTKDTAAAWKWMTYFSSPANDKKLFTKYGVDPSFKSSYSDPQLLKQHANFLTGEAANLSRAKNPPLSGEAQDFLASTLGDVFTGKSSPQQAVAQINQKWATLAVPKPLLAEAKQTGLASQ
jgi:ABC-type glycerol-3-phosphate transport system substrate-binding protein